MFVGKNQKTVISAVPAIGQPAVKSKPGPDGRSFEDASQTRILDKLVAPKQVEEKKPIIVSVDTTGIHKSFQKWLSVAKLMHETAFYDEKNMNALYAITCRQFIGRNIYSHVQITQFVNELERYAPVSKGASDFSFGDIGMFINAILNTNSDSSILLCTSQLPDTLNNVGFRNRKNLLVVGDLGNTPANSMKGGSMIIRGNVDGFAGEKMQGGTLEIYGHCGEAAGFRMTGGTIIIHGDALWPGQELLGGEVTVNGNGKLPGNGMYSGTLRINGPILELGDDITGGNIFQYDRQLVKDGIRIADPEN